MKKLVAIVVILGVAGLAQAAASDDFDTGWTASDTVVGSHGWVAGYFSNPNPSASPVIGAAGTGIDNTMSVSLVGLGTRAIGRDVSGDVVGGHWTGSMMIDLFTEGAEDFRLYVGKDTSMESTGVDESVDYMMHVGSNGTMTAGRHEHPGNPWSYNWLDVGSWDPVAAGWVQAVVDIDMNGGTSTATLNDVDDDTGAFISQLLTLDFPAPPPFDELNAISIVGRFSLWDNFNSTPEPVTLAILALGSGLALLRRRR